MLRAFTKLLEKLVEQKIMDEDFLIFYQGDLMNFAYWQDSAKNVRTAIKKEFPEFTDCEFKIIKLILDFVISFKIYLIVSILLPYFSTLLGSSTRRVGIFFKSFLHSSSIYEKSSRKNIYQP